MMQHIGATQPRSNLTRLSLHSRLRDGAAKNPCQQGFYFKFAGQVTPILGRVLSTLDNNRKHN